MGEPELSPPEEAAVAVVDDDAIVGTLELPDEVLELEEDETGKSENAEELPAVWPEGLPVTEEAADERDDAESTLDQILAWRTTTSAPETLTAQPTGGVGLGWLVGVETTVTVAARRADEFCCSGCFLIKRQELLADAVHGLCRDCAA